MINLNHKKNREYALHPLLRQTRSQSHNNKIRCLPVFLFLFQLIILSLTGCNVLNSEQNKTNKEAQCISKTSFLLNTIIKIQIYDSDDEALLEGCFDLIKKYESICSRTDKTSELYALNHRTLPSSGSGYEISKKLSDIIKYGLYYSKLSDGDFDISIAPISCLWNFTAKKPSLPLNLSIKHAIEYVNYNYIKLDGNNVAFSKKGVRIDLGGIAKGYIADKVKAYLLDNEVRSAMINLGGNILCIGSKPDQSPFNVGIQKPYGDQNETIAVIEVSDSSVVSSGIYERFFTIGNKSYHHILNPKTGYPYENNLLSVTIISSASVDGDGLSTACLALGLEKGMSLIDKTPGTYAIFITKDYELHYSQDFEKAIKIVN
jgi:thiamine biosynthesis lipoprotein